MPTLSELVLHSCMCLVFVTALWEVLGTQDSCMSVVQVLGVRWGNNFLRGVHYFKFLDFFPVWGEYLVNHGRLCTGEDVFLFCGHKPLLH